MPRYRVWWTKICEVVIEARSEHEAMSAGVFGLLPWDFHGPWLEVAPCDDQRPVTAEIRDGRIVPIPLDGAPET